MGWPGPGWETELIKATRVFKSGMRRLCLLVQPVKSGYVGKTRAALKKFLPWAKLLRLTQRKQMRNLGHGMVGGK
eukprot:1225088-Pyramimonas_sp.AAC.1